MATTRNHRTTYQARIQRNLDRGLSYQAARGHARPGEPTAKALDAVEREVRGGRVATKDDWRQAAEASAKVHLNEHRRTAGLEPLSKDEIKTLRDQLKEASKDQLRAIYEADYEEWSRRAKEDHDRGLEASPWWYR